MELFKTTYIQTVRYCQTMFNFESLGEQIARTKKFFNQNTAYWTSECINVLAVIDSVILPDYTLCSINTWQ